MKRQQEMSAWLKLIIRAIAALGLAWEIIGDGLKNPTALIVFGGLAGLPDVINYRAQVKQEIEREEESRRRRPPFSENES